MRTTASFLLIVFALALVSASGSVVFRADSHAEQPAITVLDVCSPPSSGIFSGPDLPYLTESPAPIVPGSCQWNVDPGVVTPYLFIDCSKLDYPPEV